jgi:hypothetical protein
MEIKNMTTTFESAKVGDRVYSHTFGWGEIEYVNEYSHFYTIHARFFHTNETKGFTLEGYLYSDLQIQSLFWDEVTIEAPKKPSVKLSIAFRDANRI